MKRIMKKNKIFSMVLALAFGAGAAFTSCVDTDSSLVDFNPQLNSPNDTVFSLLGIMNKMQVVADRTIILGEMRGELSSATEAATTDLNWQTSRQLRRTVIMRRRIIMPSFKTVIIILPMPIRCLLCVVRKCSSGSMPQ